MAALCYEGHEVTRAEMGLEPWSNGTPKRKRAPLPLRKPREGQLGPSAFERTLTQRARSQVGRMAALFCCLVEGTGPADVDGWRWAGGVRLHIGTPKKPGEDRVNNGLAGRVGCSTKTISRYLKALEQAGLIRYHRAPYDDASEKLQGSDWVFNAYRVHVPEAMRLRLESWYRRLTRKDHEGDDQVDAHPLCEGDGSVAGRAVAAHVRHELGLDGGGSARPPPSRGRALVLELPPAIREFWLERL